jgi:acyl-CoA thioesterase FadM
MYPLLRLWAEVRRVRRLPPMRLLDTHEAHVRVLPWDLDPWRELNNGRTLTLFDLGRVPMSLRLGFDTVARAKGWGITVAGASTRYRRRVTLFTRLRLTARVVGWDARFLYTEQAMWRGEECTAHMLVRSAFTSRQGIVPPAEVLGALGQPVESPALPDWITAWIEADVRRPWPPAV